MILIGSVLGVSCLFLFRFRFGLLRGVQHDLWVLQLECCQLHLIELSELNHLARYPDGNGGEVEITCPLLFIHTHDQVRSLTMSRSLSMLWICVPIRKSIIMWISR